MDNSGHTPRYTRLSEDQKEKQRERCRAYHATHKKEIQERIVNRKYGLTSEKYNALLDGGCQICGTKEGRLCIDHDHKTGRVRGCLCTRCNIALGGHEYVLDNLSKFEKYLGGVSIE